MAGRGGEVSCDVNLDFFGDSPLLDVGAGLLPSASSSDLGALLSNVSPNFQALISRIPGCHAPHLLRTQLLARTLREQSTRNTYMPRSRLVCTPYAHCGTHVHTACDETRLDAHVRTAWHVQATDLAASSPTVHENIKHEPSAHTRESNTRRVSPMSDKLSQAKAAQGATQRPVQEGARAGGKLGSREGEMRAAHVYEKSI